MIHTWEDIQGSLEEQCDVVVVGSGAGGGVAAQVAAAAGLDVVLLEEGGHHPDRTFTRDPLTSLARLYRSAGYTATVGRPTVALPMGRCLGGSTLINSGTCYRMPESVLEDWRRNHGLTGLAPGDLDDCYRRVEEILGVAPVPRDLRGGAGEAFLRGARELGWSHGPLRRNAPGCRGCGVCTLGCPAGAKRSTLHTYIPMAMEAGARVYADCRVERVDWKDDAALGVRGSVLEPLPGGRFRKRTRIAVRARAVVVSCGAVHTPALLAASGIGSRSLGRNLAIHPGSRLLALMDDEVRGWLGVPQGTMVDEFVREGIIMEGVFVVPGILSGGVPMVGGDVRRVMENCRNLAAYGVMVHDTSRGRVFRVPGFSEPVVRYCFNRRDARLMLRGIALAAEAFFAAGAREVYPALHGVEVLRNMDDVRALAGRKVKPSDFELMAFHPQGTCRMGGDPRTSVLDADSRHHRIRNLYVADASVFPTPLGVNPMETIQALATRTARRVVERWS